MAAWTQHQPRPRRSRFCSCRRSRSPMHRRAKPRSETRPRPRSELRLHQNPTPSLDTFALPLHLRSGRMGVRTPDLPSSSPSRKADPRLHLRGSRPRRTGGVRRALRAATRSQARLSSWEVVVHTAVPPHAKSHGPMRCLHLRWQEWAPLEWVPPRWAWCVVLQLG